MGDLNVSINNIGMRNSTKTFEANSAPLETKTLGMINFSSNNDYSVPLTFGEDGPTVYLRPDQMDAVKFTLTSATKNETMNELFGGGGPAVTVSVGGKSYSMSAKEMQTQLTGRGALMAGS